MRRGWILAVALLALALPQLVYAQTRTWFGFQVGVRGGDVPPPPVVLRSEPRLVMVDDVYVVDDDRCDDDMFQQSGAWWRMHGGDWYRARSWRGPWYAVDVRYVPRPILVVPERRWKHRHEPWAWAARDDGRYRGHDRDWRDHDRDEHGHDRDHGKHGHGHGKHGHGHDDD